MAPAPVLQVFGQPASTDVARVMACLFERDLHFELVRTDAVTKRRRDLTGADCFLDTKCSAGIGHVTLLKHGDTYLTDSRDICRYVCTELPRGRATREAQALYGTGSLERASIEKWLRAEARCFDAPSSELASHYDHHHLALMLGAPLDDEAVAEGERRVRAVMGVYDGALARTRYLAGDESSLADLCHLPGAHRLLAVAGGERGRRLLGSQEHVSRWYHDVSARPAWRRRVGAMHEDPNCLFDCETSSSRAHACRPGNRSPGLRVVHLCCHPLLPLHRTC